jgi:hypothetical protein
MEKAGSSPAFSIFIAYLKRDDSVIAVGRPTYQADNRPPI